MQIQNVLKGSYWFYQPFIAVGAVRWFWIISFLVMILAGLIAKIVRISSDKLSGGTKEVLRRSGNLLITMGSLGWLWMFFRQQQVAFLAWRFWLLFWVVLFIWQAVKIAIYATKRLPAISNEQAKRDLQAKYLPKK